MRGGAIIESHLAEKISFLLSPGLPLSIDTALIALVYVAIGFFQKERIKRIMCDDSIMLDSIAVFLGGVLLVFCALNYSRSTPYYYFDMKPIYYKELLSAVIIPCAFGVVLMRVVYHFMRIKVLIQFQNFLALCGRVTIPIMFMHIPLNHLKDVVDYGRIGYVLIGIGVPLVVTLLFGRYPLMRKLFGLPKLFDE